MQLVLIELNEINFEYAKKYFDVLKIDTIKKVSKELINTESEIFVTRDANDGSKAAFGRISQ